MKEYALRNLLQSHCPKNSEWKEINGEPKEEGLLQIQTYFYLIKSKHNLWFCIEEISAYENQTEELRLTQLVLWVSNKKLTSATQGIERDIGTPFLEVKWRSRSKVDSESVFFLTEENAFYPSFLCEQKVKLNFLRDLQKALWELDQRM